jgi:hypothetical protein
MGVKKSKLRVGKVMARGQLTINAINKLGESVGLGKVGYKKILLPKNIAIIK